MAQADYHLKIDGIEGESQDEKHKNEIQIQSFSFGATQTGSAGAGMGSGSSKVNVQDFHFTKEICKASPNLFAHCCSGKHFPTATLTVRKAGEKAHEYLVVKFHDVIISSYTTSGHGGGGLVQESGSLNFAKCEFKYVLQNADGTAGAAISKTYDVAANKLT